MPEPEVWFAIPSASVDRCRKVLPVWRKMGYRTAILQNRERGDVPADVSVWFDYYPGWPGSINILAREIVPASAPIIVSGGDDMLPDADHSAQEIAAQFLERFPDTFGVMQPHGDDFLETAQFCGSPWLGRAWCERMYQGSGPMFQGYVHHGADDELFWVGKCLGALWTRPDLTQYHDHFLREGEVPPQWWVDAVEKNDERDTLHFIARAAHFFPGHEPVGGAPTFDRDMFRREYTRRAEKHWEARYAPKGAANPDPADRRMIRALEECAREGYQRVCIYGAGKHTRRLGGALMTPPVRVLAIIDDNPELHARLLWNYPIVSPDESVHLRPDAIIVSSDTFEDRLVTAAESVAERVGSQVIRLYGGAAQPAGAVA